MLKYQRQRKEQRNRMRRVNVYISKNVIINRDIQDIDNTIKKIYKEIKQTNDYSIKQAKFQKELSKLRSKRYYLVKQQNFIEIKITKNSC